MKQIEANKKFHHLRQKHREKCLRTLKCHVNLNPPRMHDEEKKNSLLCRETNRIRIVV